MVTRGRGLVRRCPIRPCENAVRAGHLACGYHWRQVPKDLRDEVWRTWRSFNAGTGSWDDYAVARDTALTALREPA